MNRAGISAARIAAAQHGVVSLPQLRAVGFTTRTVARWAESGRLHRVHHRVFAVGSRDLDPKGRVMAAVLTGSSSGEAVASHRSAGFLLGLFDPLPAVIDIICPTQHGRQIDGIRPHFVAFPDPHERGWFDGIPCTSPARTLVDLAGVLSERSLRDAVERAATARVLDVAAVEAILNRGRRRGAKRLREVLAEWRPAAKLARRSNLRSPFEARLLPLLAATDLPSPEINARVEVESRTLEVDLLWRSQRLVVEADSRRHHGIEAAFERDRKRDRDLLDARYTVIRVTHDQVEAEPAAIVTSIRRALQRGATC